MSKRKDESNKKKGILHLKIFKKNSKAVIVVYIKVYAL